MQNEDEEIQRACIKTKCRFKREKILDGFIKEMENIDIPLITDRRLEVFIGILNARHSQLKNIYQEL